jgi:hypothetical protein
MPIADIGQKQAAQWWATCICELTDVRDPLLRHCFGWSGLHRKLEHYCFLTFK